MSNTTDDLEKILVESRMKELEDDLRDIQRTFRNILAAHLGQGPTKAPACNELKDLTFTAARDPYVRTRWELSPVEVKAFSGEVKSLIRKKVIYDVRSIVASQRRGASKKAISKIVEKKRPQPA